MIKFAKDLLKLNKMHILLVLLLVILIIFPLPLPLDLAALIDTKLGSLLIVIFSILIFIKINPIIGVLAFIAGYVMLNRASISTGSDVIRKYTPNEDQKHQDMLHLHTQENGKTLEEEVVENIPVRENILSEDPYKPIYTSSDISYSDI